MKRITFLIFVLLIQFKFVFSQDKTFLKEYHKYLNEIYGDRYKDKGNLISEIDSLNFTPLWLPGLTKAEDKNFTSVRPDFLGYIGNDFQRLQIRFLEIIQNADNPKEYFVYGKTKFKDTIRSFQGIITVKLIREYKLDTLGGEDFLVDMQKVKKQGIVICDFKFYEDQSKSNFGKFSGILLTNFYVDVDNKLKYNAIKAFSDSYSNNLFKGTWTSSSTKVKKPANWGEFDIPDSKDLNYGAGEFSPNEKYFDKGWKDYFKDNSEWWK